MNPGITSKEAILQVCRKIAAEQGLSALSMRAVASECGIALGTLYNYYSDKDALVLATVESVWQDSHHTSSRRDPDAGPVSDLRRFRCHLRHRGHRTYPDRCGDQLLVSLKKIAKNGKPDICSFCAAPTVGEGPPLQWVLWDTVIDILARIRSVLAFLLFFRYTIRKTTKERKTWEILR